MPVQGFFGQGDVGTALQGVVFGQRMLFDCRCRAGHGDDLFGQFQNGEFAGIAQVHRPGDGVGRRHQAHQPVDQIIHVAKRPGLGAVAVNGDRLVPERLHDEVGDHPPVAGMHARTVSIEDAGHPDRQLVLAVIVEKQRFRTALAFVVAGPRPDRIDVAPVAFRLRVHFRVAVDLGGGGLQDAGAGALGQPQHVDGAMHDGLGRLHRVELVMHGAGRAGQIVDLFDFHIKREGDVVAHHLELRMVQQMHHVVAGPGIEVIDANDVQAVGQQPFAQVRAQEPGAAGDHHAGSCRCAHGLQGSLAGLNPAAA